MPCSRFVEQISSQKTAVWEKKEEKNYGHCSQNKMVDW